MLRTTRCLRGCARALHARHTHTFATTLAANDAAALAEPLSRALERVPSTNVLLYAVSRDMPSDVLAHLVHTIQHSAARTRLGVVSASLPIGDGAKHSVAIAAMDDAVPFRSTISGGARIAVGRWPAQKDLWKMGNSLRTDGLDSGTDWRALWGRENAENRLPGALEEADASSFGTVLVVSDNRPQGLIEGLDAHYGRSTIAGIVGARTPFATGREYTLLAEGFVDDGIFEEGALGVAIPATARTETTFDGLVPIGDMLEITA